MPTNIRQNKGEMNTAARKTLPVESLKKTIAYFHLLSFCIPEKIADFNHSMMPMRKALAESANMSETEYFKKAIPEVCRRMVAFHEDTREPSQSWIAALVNTASEAAQSPAKASAFQQEMSKIASLPPRAKPEGRLHRKKGCQFCQAPCFYGYFTLVSDPQFSQLQDLFAVEARKPAHEQSPLNPVYRFTLNHLERLTGTREGYSDIKHLANLSYCLLMLGIAKSRMAVPEQQLKLFQAANQEFIRRNQAANQAKTSNK